MRRNVFVSYAYMMTKDGPTKFGWSNALMDGPITAKSLQEITVGIKETLGSFAVTIISWQIMEC